MQVQARRSKLFKVTHRVGRIVYYRFGSMVAPITFRAEDQAKNFVILKREEEEGD